MNIETRGFTLIELLVVVLIIGILSAVALPQYQAAVDKTHYTAMIPAVHAVKDAQELYKLANGNYTTDISDLAEAFPAGCSNDGTCPGFVLRLQGSSVIYGVLSLPKLTNAYLLENNQAACYAYRWDGERGRRLCKSMGGIARQTKINTSCSGDCTTYTLP